MAPERASGCSRTVVQGLELSGGAGAGGRGLGLSPARNQGEERHSDDNAAVHLRV